MNGSTAALTPEQRLELDGLPKLNELPADKLIAVTHRQISLMSTLPLGSVGAAIVRSELKPAFPGSNVFAVGALRAFCQQHAAATAQRVALAVLARPGDAFVDPRAAADAFIAGLLRQAKS
jgi:hypothetical protein